MEYKDIKKNVWAFLENQVDFQDDGGLKMEFAQKDNEIDCIDCFYEQNEKNLAYFLRGNSALHDYRCWYDICFVYR